MEKIKGSEGDKKKKSASERIYFFLGYVDEEEKK